MPRAYVRKKGGVVKYRNITVDADIVAILNQKSVDLEATLGFKPTVSQTMRYLLKKELSQ